MTDGPDVGARPANTLKLSSEGAVLFAEISAPPMNLRGRSGPRPRLADRLAEADHSARLSFQERRS